MQKVNKIALTEISCKRTTVRRTQEIYNMIDEIIEIAPNLEIAELLLLQEALEALAKKMGSLGRTKAREEREI